MLNFILFLYTSNIILGVLCFFISIFLLKKYLNIDLIKILKNGFLNIKKIFKK